MESSLLLARWRVSLVQSFHETHNDVDLKSKSCVRDDCWRFLFASGCLYFPAVRADRRPDAHARSTPKHSMLLSFAQLNAELCLLQIQVHVEKEFILLTLKTNNVANVSSVLYNPVNQVPAVLEYFPSSHIMGPAFRLYNCSTANAIHVCSLSIKKTSKR